MAAAGMRADTGRRTQSTDPWLKLEQITVEGMGVRVGRALPVGRPRGTVLVLTGRAEFLEKYKETIAELVAKGYAVASFDWRGQGGSGRFTGLLRQGHVARVDDYLADLTAVLDHLEQRRLPGPG
jgi:lysophospholipase